MTIFLFKKCHPKTNGTCASVNFVTNANHILVSESTAKIAQKNLIISVYVIFPYPNLHVITVNAANQFSIKIKKNIIIPMFINLK